MHQSAYLLNHHQTYTHRHPPLTGWSPLTTPPPERAICVHIRHGDKAQENMRCVYGVCVCGK